MKLETNDSNILNQEFYNELLHIIGLYETNDNFRRILRLKPNERKPASFLESVIAAIETNKPSISHLPSGENRLILNAEEQIFNVAFELCLTWINRVIFLKLLEAQLISFNEPSFKSEFEFLNIQKISNFNELSELFFDVLLIEPQKRKPHFQQKFAHIPYLNNSLFEETQIENEVLKINQLNDNALLPIFDETVLKDSGGKPLTGTRTLLQYLFDFLDSYNFSSNPTEQHPSAKTLISSSVLGLIFEKLNGYKEGSFYTPGFVTMYMCRETLRKATIQKFVSTQLPNFENVHDFNDLRDKMKTISLKQANDIFNSIKICDPAVGSGHFLVSALNELIAIKSELGILTDHNGELLQNVYCQVQNDELYVTHFEQPFVYDYHKQESQFVQETIFNEKRTLIENCLFGVDINPKSVQICRLRLWIELLKNAYYKNTHYQEFKELETLPNIHINIKCGNSLISKIH